VVGRIKHAAFESEVGIGWVKVNIRHQGAEEGIRSYLLDVGAQMHLVQREVGGIESLLADAGHTVGDEDLGKLATISEGPGGNARDRILSVLISDLFGDSELALIILLGVLICVVAIGGHDGLTALYFIADAIDLSIVCLGRGAYGRRCHQGCQRKESDHYVHTGRLCCCSVLGNHNRRSIKDKKNRREQSIFDQIIAFFSKNASKHQKYLAV